MPAKGIERVRANFQRLKEEISDKRTDRAVYAILSQGAAVAATMTPADTGTLINSQTAPQLTQKGWKTTGTVGYTAKYAAAVHEAPGVLKGLPRTNFAGRSSKGNYWDPSGEPAFLRKGFEEIKPAIPKILKEVYGSK